MEVLVGSNHIELAALPDRSVDVLYLDAWNGYVGVRYILDIMREKISDNGWIVVNDYIMFDHNKNERFGVVQAVNEFLVAEQWEMLYLALHPEMYCDVVLRKISNQENSAPAAVFPS